MAVEIERKFLVTGDGWQGHDGIRYRQGYLSVTAQCVVRVRIGGGHAYMTAKGSNTGIRRLEYEYPIPETDGNEIIDTLCDGRVVEKTRYRVPFGNFIWEVDEFHGANDRLLLAEIELENEEQPFVKPDWVGADVSEDPRYTNAMLAVHPFNNWSVR